MQYQGLVPMRRKEEEWAQAAAGRNGRNLNYDFAIPPAHQPHQTPICPIVSPSSYLERTLHIRNGGDAGGLPCLRTGIRYRHRYLNSISSDTLVRLLQGEFVEQLGRSTRYHIIDCRYPYEFAGGHIRGAQNIYTRAQIQVAFPRPFQAPSRHPWEQLRCHRRRHRRIYVFLCEFSLDRAPKLLRFLHGKDRRLDYPELYLLHKGYKSFYARRPDLCEPFGYVPMRSVAYEEAFRHFQAQSRASRINGEGGA